MRIRRVLKLAAAAVAIALVVAAAALQFLGSATRATLSHSVATTVGQYVGSCKHQTGAHWYCSLISSEGSYGGVAYSVTVDGRCWSGELVVTGGVSGLPRRPSGCVGLTDRLFDNGSQFVLQKGYY
jgi:hypothetical protein